MSITKAKIMYEMRYQLESDDLASLKAGHYYLALLQGENDRLHRRIGKKVLSAQIGELRSTDWDFAFNIGHFHVVMVEPKVCPVITTGMFPGCGKIVIHQFQPSSPSGQISHQVKEHIRRINGIKTKVEQYSRS